MGSLPNTSYSGDVVTRVVCSDEAVWCGVVWCGVVWCGVVWCGVVWCGVVWCGVVWCGVVWCGVVWCGVPKALLPNGGGWDALHTGNTKQEGCVSKHVLHVVPPKFSLGLGLCASTL